MSRVFLKKKVQFILYTQNRYINADANTTGINKSAAWHGTRIILRQVSPESLSIFDFILELYRVCDEGDWAKLASKAQVLMRELRLFLEYSAIFLGNVGNYYVCILFFYPIISIKCHPISTYI